MNWDRIEGDWKQFVGKVKEKWAKLTDDDIAAINGKREQLEGKIQERYGHGKDQVKKDVDDWPVASNERGRVALNHWRRGRDPVIISRPAASHMAGIG